MLLTNIDVNGVVSVCSLDSVHKLQIQHLRSLTQEPVVCLLACQPGAVDSGLLACTDSNGLSVLYVAD